MKLLARGLVIATALLALQGVVAGIAGEASLRAPPSLLINNARPAICREIQPAGHRGGAVQMLRSGAK